MSGTPFSVERDEIYKHFEGESFRIVGIAVDSVTYERLVVYESMGTEKVMWVKPISDFLKRLDIHGQFVPQFKKEEKQQL